MFFDIIKTDACPFCDITVPRDVSISGNLAQHLYLSVVMLSGNLYDVHDAE